MPASQHLASRALRFARIASLAAAVVLGASWVHSYFATTVVERKWGRLQPPPGVAPIPLPAPSPGTPPPRAPLVRGQPVWTFHALSATLSSRRGVIALSRTDSPSLASTPQDLSSWAGYGGWSAALHPARPGKQRTPRWFFDSPTQWRAGGLGFYSTGVGGGVERVVQVPHGLLFGLSLAPVAMRWALRRRRARRAADVRCPGCGYSREGLSADTPCPECGQPASAGGARP